MIVILGAMQEEIENLLSKLDDKEEIKIHNSLAYKGKLYDKNVIIAYSGIGMVSSAITTTLLIEKFNPKFLIFTGVAGAVDKRLNPGDVVIANDLIEYLFDATAFGYKMGEIPRENIREIKAKKIKIDIKNIFYGRIISGDKFVSSLIEKEKIGKEFEALAVDMESASFAHTCFKLKKEFMVVRSISDSIHSESVMEYNEFLNIAIKNNEKVLKEILSKLV